VLAWPLRRTNLARVDSFVDTEHPVEAPDFRESKPWGQQILRVDVYVRAAGAAVETGSRNPRSPERRDASRNDPPSGRPAAAPAARGARHRAVSALAGCTLMTAQRAVRLRSCDLGLSTLQPRLDLPARRVARSACSICKNLAERSRNVGGFARHFASVRPPALCCSLVFGCKLFTDCSLGLRMPATSRRALKTTADRETDSCSSLSFAPSDAGDDGGDQLSRP
jgi:hypothetical protein